MTSVSGTAHRSVNLCIDDVEIYILGIIFS